MIAIKMPHVRHENHLCYLHNVGLVQSNPEAYKKLVRDGRFMCKACGRVAQEAENVCAPEKL